MIGLNNSHQSMLMKKRTVGKYKVRRKQQQQKCVGELYILFFQPSFTGTMEYLHNDIEQIPKVKSEPRLAQAPDQILSISVKDTAQTLIFVLGEWHGCRFLTVLVLLAVWLLS
jgi:hypothetical protein